MELELRPHPRFIGSYRLWSYVLTDYHNEKTHKRLDEMGRCKACARELERRLEQEKK